MKKIILLFATIIPTLVYSQEKKFTSFELLYDISQQVNLKEDYSMYDLEKIKIYNDTLFTMLIKKNHMSKIPLTKKAISFEHEKFILPTDYTPITFTRNEGKWYFLLPFKGLGYMDNEKKYITLIPKAPKWQFQNFFFVNNQIVLIDTDEYNGLFELYDLKGNLMDSTSISIFDFNNSIIYNNTIWDGYDQIKVSKNKVNISESYDINKYGNENTFVGGYQNMGFFINYEKRNKIVIRDMETKFIKESLTFPHFFKESDLGIVEEGRVNLRILSEDNNTFYFVTLKKGHLMIYKAVR